MIDKWKEGIRAGKMTQQIKALDRQRARESVQNPVTSTHTRAYVSLSLSLSHRHKKNIEIKNSYRKMALNLR